MSCNILHDELPTFNPQAIRLASILYPVNYDRSLLGGAIRDLTPDGIIYNVIAAVSGVGSVAGRRQALHNGF